MTTLDARGLACPLPLALARRRMAELAPGEILLVLATDPEAPIDLAAWADDEGHGFRDLSDPAAGASPPADSSAAQSSAASELPGHTAGSGWLTVELRKAG